MIAVTTSGAGMQFSILYLWNRNLHIFNRLNIQNFFFADKKFYHSALGAIKEHSILVVMTKPFFSDFLR